MMTRDEALALMHEFTPSEALRRHMYAVEAAMTAYARKYGEDEATWGLVGLLHDFDYERYPNDAHSPTEEHPSFGVALLREKGIPEPMLEAILGHASYTGVPRTSHMAKTLFAVDELAGFITAVAYVRPTKLAGMKPRSVKKKLKDKAFAAAVSREDIQEGTAELGIDLSSYRSKSTDEFRDLVFDCVITVCDHAAKNCPAWLGQGIVTHIGFPDPAKADGTDEERMAVFRQVRDGLREKVIAYLNASYSPSSHLASEKVSM